jgi:regulator of nonsense transcripts 1
VLRITSSEEVALELHGSKQDGVPSSETSGFAAELTWNSTAYDRMHAALRTFAENSECMSLYLYHKILGHQPAEPPMPLARPPMFKAPGMPVPNHSQVRLARTMPERTACSPNSCGPRPCACLWGCSAVR